MAKDTIFLDPKKFKHVKSDKHTTTLRHADGHELTIAHNAVTPSMQKALSSLGGSAKAAQTPLQADEAHDQTKMAKGGKVEPKPKAQPQEPKQKPAVKKHEDPRFGSTTVIDNEDKRNGTVRQKYAKGDLVEENPDLQHDSVDDAQAALDDGVPRDGQQDYTQDPYNAVDAITTRLPSSPNIDTDAKPQYELAANDMAQDGLSPKRDAVADRPDMPQGAPQLASAEMPSQGGVRAPAATPSEEVGLTQDSQQPSQGLAQPSQDPGMPDMGGLINRGYNAAQRGAELRAGAEHSFGTATAGIQGDAAAASQKAKDTFKQSYDETLQELHAHMQDVKEGQIDPDKYWTGDKDGNGSHSRVMAGIGMILAGFNPTSNKNAAIEYIQHQIDKSVEAQSKNLESKQNLVRANLEQFHNLKDATEMARLQQADVVNHYMDQAMAKAKTPFAQAALQEAKSTIAQQYAPLAMQLSIRQTLNKLSTMNDPAALSAAITQIDSMPGGQELTKPLKERIVPGVGTATVPVPGAVREQITSQQKLQSAAQDLLSYSRGHTNIVPGTAAYNTGVQKAAIVQQMVREGMLGTVFRESEKPLLNQFVNHNPAGAFKAMSTDPKLRTLIESNEAQLNTLKSSYGLPTSHGAADASKSGPVKGKDGKMYQLDPSGKYYIPVGK